EHLVVELLVRHALEIAGPLLDRALDGVVRHVDRAPLVDRGAQARVAVDVAATDAGRDRDLLDDLRPDLRLLRVGGLLLVLDLRPPIVPGHDAFPTISPSRRANPDHTPAPPTSVTASPSPASPRA